MIKKTIIMVSHNNNHKKLCDTAYSYKIIRITSMKYNKEKLINFERNCKNLIQVKLEHQFIYIMARN